MDSKGDSSPHYVAKGPLSALHSVLERTVIEFVGTLPAEWRPGPDFFGFPWEPVMVTVLMGYISFLVVLWRTVLALLKEVKDGEKQRSKLTEEMKMLQKISKDMADSIACKDCDIEKNAAAGIPSSSPGTLMAGSSCSASSKKRSAPRPINASAFASVNGTAAQPMKGAAFLPMNTSIYPPIKRPIAQPISRTAAQPMKETAFPPNRPAIQPMNRPTGQPMNEFLSMNRPFHPPMDRSEIQPMNRLPYPPLDRHTYPPMNRPPYPPLDRHTYPPMNRPPYPPLDRHSYPPMNRPPPPTVNRST
ncbi:UNVERIFIED_CONTAM: hypothetical protein FKN15_013676 [Acipenser sinensis]